MATGNQMPTQQEFAVHVGITRQTAGEMIRKGTIPAHGTMDELRLAYCAHLREVAAGRSSAKAQAAGLDLTAERARLSKLQADKVEIELAELRGEVVRTEDVAEVMQGHVIAARSRLLALPSKLVALFSPDMRPQTLALAEGVVREALEELSSDEFVDEVRRRITAENGDVMAPAAEADGKRVGGPAPQAKQRGKRRAGAAAPRR
jgi:phage terminase Nu1 subunit (DNA packaging protein)